VIEDIDALFGRNRASKNAKSPLSFSGLLNALDGVGAASGQVGWMAITGFTSAMRMVDFTFVRRSDYVDNNNQILCR
jgi:hypothetical protein